MIPFILFFFHVAGLVSSVHAVMATRTSQGAIAWCLSLVTFPYIAVPAYWVLGRSKFQGYVTAHREDISKIVDISVKTIEKVDSYISGFGEGIGSIRALEKLSVVPFLNGNNVELLIDGDATFSSIFKGIDEAKHYILIQFFIVKDDEIGNELKNRLLAKAKEGIGIYFLYDEIGCHQLPKKYIQELRDAGVKMFPFNTRKGFFNRFQINFRNHCKNVVVDGKITWIGGHNVGDEYLGKNPKFGHWRDTHIKITGPAALAAQLAFLTDYHWATDKTLDLNWEATSEADWNTEVLIMPSGPADTVETGSLMFVHAIHSAQERIWIASPYFVPDEAVIAALQLACLRGVEVRILIPDKPDHLLVYLAAFSYFDELSKIGVQFYRYDQGFLHQKVMLIDESATAVGTANFDNRSFRLNFEITAFVEEKAFNKEIETMLLADIAASREMKQEEVLEKPFWFKVAVRYARLTAPIQ